REWIWDKLRKPQNGPQARMPEMSLADEEALAVLAYLEDIAEEDFPKVAWSPWLLKPEEDLSDEELDALFELMDQGQAVWRQARCTICHTVNGPGEDPVGGFVDLRVGGVDLTDAGTRLKRDWLYHWLENPKGHFPRTLMPRYRLGDEEIRSLVELVLRDPTFLPEEGERPTVPPPTDPDLVEKGGNIIRLSRCVVCHDIEGISEVLPADEQLPSTGSGFERIAYDVSCLTCHAIDGRGGTDAPDLTTAGSRLRYDWIREFVKRPDFVRPLSQQMPRFNLSTNEAETVARYLSRWRLDPETPATIPGMPFTAREVSKGKALFLEKGCLACHGTKDIPGGSVGPDLRAVADRLTPGYLYQHLLMPHRTHRYSAEPDYALEEMQARPLAAFLSTQGEKPTGAKPEPTASPPPPDPSTEWDGLETPEDRLINRREQARGAFLARPNTLYLHYCAPCHGETGRGDGRLWVTGLMPLPRDLTDAQYMHNLDEAYLVKVITEGTAAVGKSSLCPPWGTTIPKDKVARLARYVEALSRQEGARIAAFRAGSSGGNEPVLMGERFPWMTLAIVVIEILILLRTVARRIHGRVGKVRPS
ncbi:MAG: c-type cytochrome, partial [Acidobacteriota bacterium]